MKNNMEIDFKYYKSLIICTYKYIKIKVKNRSGKLTGIELIRHNMLEKSNGSDCYSNYIKKCRCKKSDKIEPKSVVEITKDRFIELTKYYDELSILRRITYINDCPKTLLTPDDIDSFNNNLPANGLTIGALKEFESHKGKKILGDIESKYFYRKNGILYTRDEYKGGDNVTKGSLSINTFGDKLIEVIINKNIENNIDPNNVITDDLSVPFKPIPMSRPKKSCSGDDFFKKIVNGTHTLVIEDKISKELNDKPKPKKSFKVKFMSIFKKEVKPTVTDRFNQLLGKY